MAAWAFVDEQIGGRLRRGETADPLVLLLGELPAGDQPPDVGFGHSDHGLGDVPLRLGHLDPRLGLEDLRP